MLGARRLGREHAVQLDEARHGLVVGDQVDRATQQLDAVLPGVVHELPGLLVAQLEDRRKQRWLGVEVVQQAAAAADIAVVVVGTDAKVESEGFDRETLALPGHQDELWQPWRAPTPARSPS